MSFDLFLAFLDEDNNLAADRDAVKAVMARYPYRGPDDYNFYLVRCGDIETEFSAPGLEDDQDFDSCAFHIRATSPELIEFVYEIALAGGFILFNPQGADTPESAAMIAPSAEILARAPEDLYNHPVLCESAQQLGTLLFDDYSSWLAFKDRVIGRDSGKEGD